MKKLFLTFFFFLLVSQIGFAVTANKVWRIPSGATLPAWGPVNLSDGTNAITGALPSTTNLPSIGQQVSSSCGTFSTSSGSYVDVTNLSVSITSNGRPVYILLQPDGTANACAVGSTGSSRYQITRDGSSIAVFGAFSPSGVGTNSPCSSVMFLDISPSAASHTYKLQAEQLSGTTTVQNAVLVVYQL